ncbi:hypothetical protein ACFUTY_22360 [Streptomyces sp. NPDC057362]|uniref:hypothetical protein n=1 Tax=Streptomyces sp. NPDC057362 TaxID=3346106 RepID=UPI003624FAB6
MPSLSFDLPRLAAAMPDAIRVALQQVMPDRYTPELAEQIAADAVAQFASERGEGALR